jgi:hypothetical protein
MNSTIRIVIGVAMAAGLVACGGGDDDGPTLDDQYQAALDQYEKGCKEGHPGDCDQLRIQAPAGSEMAEFGATCGDRVEAATSACVHRIGIP